MERIFNLMDPKDLAEFIELTKDRPQSNGMTKAEYEIMLAAAYEEKLAYILREAENK